MSKNRQKAALEGSTTNWIDEQFQIICRDVLDRHPLRRGSLVIEDSYLKAMITSGSVILKSRRSLDAE